MDVPELTDDFVEMVGEQCDVQSGDLKPRDLEIVRDNNLVAMMRALKAQGWGAGKVLSAHDQRLQPDAAKIDYAQPVRTLDRVVPVDWTDYNGHMNEARYLEAFSKATDRFMELMGCDQDYIASGGSYFTAETHIRHLDEVNAGAHIHIETLCLSGAGKKMHVFNSLYHSDGRLLATGEQMLIHVSLETRRASAPSPEIAARLAKVEMHHAKLPRPDGIGRGIGQGK